MPLRDLFLQARAILAEGRSDDAASGDADPWVAEREAAQAATIELQRRLAVAEHRLWVVSDSHRTAVRAMRRFVQERDHLVGAREDAEVGLSIAVGERQRTMMLNDRLLSDLRASEDARERLEAENRRLRGLSKAGGTAEAAAPIGSEQPAVESA